MDQAGWPISMWGGATSDNDEGNATPTSLAFTFTPTNAVTYDQVVTITASQPIWAVGGDTDMTIDCTATATPGGSDVVANALASVVASDTQTLVVTAHTAGLVPTTAVTIACTGDNIRPNPLSGTVVFSIQASSDSALVDLLGYNVLDKRACVPVSPCLVGMWADKSGSADTCAPRTPILCSLLAVAVTNS